MVLDVLQLAVSLLLFFFSAWLVAYGIGLLRRRRKTPEPAGGVRIRGENAMYRSRFLEARSGTWKLGAPLQRDRFVPIRPGEALLIEAPTTSGVLLFRTVVTERDVSDHSISISIPRGVRPNERRDSKRVGFTEITNVLVDGVPGTIHNLSEGGARIAARSGYRAGDQVQVKLPWMANPMQADVLDVAGPELRLRFHHKAQLP